MPRERNLFKRGPVWWLRATVKGVEYRESLRTGDRQIARARRDKRLNEIEGAARFGIIRHSWLEAVAAWASSEAGQIAPTTARRYAVSLIQAQPHLSPYDVAKIDPEAIGRLVRARLENASPATVRRDLTAVSRVLEFACAERWREGNPALDAARRIKERRDPIVLPEMADFDFVIAAAPPRFGALIKAALLTGARQDELVRSTWRALNERAGTLEIIGKGNKRRTLRLSAPAAAHFSAQPRTLGSDLIFCKGDGSPFSRASARFNQIRAVAAARAKRAGRPFRGFRFHDLRHLFAVEALRGGTSIYRLQKHLGHGSIAVTELYVEFLTPEEAEAAKRGDDTKRGTSETV